MLETTTDIWTYGRYFKIITEPIVEPITVEEVKDFARIDGNDEDAMIETFVVTARHAAELYTGRAFISQSVRLVLDEWNLRALDLPMPPLISVTNVQTVDEDDSTTDFDSAKYYVVTESIPGKVVIKNDYALPSNDVRTSGGYRVNYIAGYGTTPSSVPRAIRTALLLWVTEIYEKRDLAGEPSPDVKKLLYDFRVRNL